MILVRPYNDFLIYRQEILVKISMKFINKDKIQSNDWVFFSYDIKDNYCIKIKL